MTKWISLLTLLVATSVFAAASALAASSGHDAHGPVHVPKVVIYQLINVVILFSVLFYFLKGAVVKFYKDRKAHYLVAAERSKAAREKAEQEYLDIKHKLHQLEATADQSYSRAQVEAKSLREQMIKDGQEMAARIKHEAEQTAKIEIQKAQQHLREQLLKDAVMAAKATLTSDIGAADHQKLQGEFVNNVQAVNP